MKVLGVLGILLGIGMAAMVVISLPDISRYIKMKAM
jgi:hypothetical protein